MVLTLNTTSLNLVKAEVDATLSQVEASLGSFVEERDNPAPLGSCVEGLEQVYGALRLIELPGAVELSHGLQALMRQVQTKGAAATDEDFAALGNGIMVLIRYLEYVQIKGLGWPQLLIPTINQIHMRLGVAALAEGYFLDIKTLPALPSTPALNVVPAQLPALLRRLRLMYQTGLIPVLRDQADVPHFRLMARAMERVEQIGHGKPAAMLWWVALAMVEALQNGVAINNARKSLLGRLDRELKALLTGTEPVLDRRLLNDCLYVVGLAETGEHVLPVRQAFGLNELCLTEQAMMAEYELMCGPGGSVIKTVASVLKDELAHVKDSLDMIARGAHGGGTESYQTVADNLTKTSQTLVMLGLLDASKTMREQADNVRGWHSEPGNESLHRLVDALMSVENAVAGLVKQVTPGIETTIINNRISIHQLDEARALLIAESRSGLSLAKRAISSYLESDRDLMHLTNVPATLQSVAGGLSFLMIERGAEVLRACGQYIDQRMLNTEQQPPMADLETLADAISSVDYYLESLEANKPIGESVLDIADESMAELGFPVQSKQAA